MTLSRSETPINVIVAPSAFEYLEQSILPY